MNCPSRKVFSDRPYGYPPGMSDKSYSEWHRALDELRSLEDAHQAALCFRSCCEILQHLLDGGVITSAEHANMRCQLYDLWADSVRRLDQPDSTRILDQ